MTKLSIILFSLATVASCGDNLKGNTDGGHGSDAGSGSNAFPAAPAIGAQIDRMARPAINTVLNHGFDTNAATKGAAEDAYNQDGSPSGWQQYAPAFASALGILDGLDTGLMCVSGTCTPMAQAKGAGCGNQVLYNMQLGGDQGGTHDSMSYLTLGGILTDDELWLDTTKTVCDLGPNGSHQNYLAVELNALSNGVIPNTCGGRDPLNDVIDTSYSALAAGFAAFDTSTFHVGMGDGVDPHTDVSDTTFPFLGPPHS